MPEKFQIHLREAIRNIQIADHMTYVTLPLINEKRLLLKIFDEIYKAIINCINAVLNYEYLYKRVKIYDDKSENLQTFMNKCAKNYDITNEQTRKIKEILDISKKHKESAMEFIKKERVVILSDNLRSYSLDIMMVKEYLLIAKGVLMNITQKIKK